MRLLDTTTFELRNGDQHAFRQEGYAILSHRWIGLEITFDDLSNYQAEFLTGRRPLRSPQADKILGACSTARNQGIRWIWIDTCCINKRSATEEAESINSMFKWYREAKLCITYLADVKRDPGLPVADPRIFKRTHDDRPSEWFFRGWTLQEILAPHDMQFYDMDWNYIGTKKAAANPLAYITGIDARYLTGAEHFREACIAAKMSWMAQRTTTREEDMAYSMVGIFGITMTPQYGEGRGAFMRLQEQLLTTHVFDESLFAWAMPHPSAGAEYGLQRSGWGPGEWGLLAASASWFLGSGDITIPASAPAARSFVMTPKGIRAPILTDFSAGGDVRLIKNVSAVLWLSIIGAPIACIGFQYLKRLARERSLEDYGFRLNCRGPDGSGRLANVVIYLRPKTAEKVVGNTATYVEATRIRCSELGASPKPITNLGEGIVFQPRPGFTD
ncbi:hypothetical protein F4777DRAFT_411475 [Nemania sp. FL0916]|nr:hypothetical protein F4777DRAFT_411475 [Nemania sp. FL0916]